LIKARARWTGKCEAATHRSPIDAQKIATGLTGEPVPVTIGNGVTVNRNFHRFAQRPLHLF
jgi:hypothetical protein